MRVIAHPFRIAPDGMVATVEQWSVQQLAQLVAAVVSTEQGERPLAPLYGLMGPPRRPVSEAEVRATVELCEPDVRVVGVASRWTDRERQAVEVTAAWAQDEE